MSSGAWGPCSSQERCCSLLSGAARSRQHDNDDDQGDDDKAADPDVPDDGRDQVEVAAEQIAGTPDADSPGKTADRAANLEAPERHAGHAGEHRSPCAESEDDPCGQYGFVAVAREEDLCPGDVLRADPEQMAEPLDERPAPAVAHVIADVGAGDRP